MEILQTLRERYTTKVYDPTFDLSDEQLSQIREILRLCPSSLNSQPWAFQLIGRGELKDRLAEVSFMNKERVRDESHLLVIYVYREVDVFTKERTASLSESAQAFFRSAILSRGDEGVQDWMRCQAYIALGVLLTSVASLGIDSTPMEGIQLDEYDRLLGQAKYRPVLAVSLGKRTQDDSNQPGITPKVRRDDQFL